MLGPFYRYGNWVSERLRKLFQITQQVNNQIQDLNPGLPWRTEVKKYGGRGDVGGHWNNKELYILSSYLETRTYHYWLFSVLCIPVLMALACAGLGKLQRLEESPAIPGSGWSHLPVNPQGWLLCYWGGKLSGFQKQSIPTAPPPSYDIRWSQTLPLPRATFPTAQTPRQSLPWWGASILSPSGPACPLHPRHPHYRVRPPTEPFNHPECKATPQAQATGRENRTCSCALMSVMGQMDIQIEMRITRQIRPWQNSCSLASGLQDSRICAYLSNGRACKTPPQRAPRSRSCSSGQRPHSFPRPQTCPHPRLHLLMEFAIRFKGDWNLKN